MEFTKEETNVTKGVAICLMFFNHLYAFPDRLIHGNYYIPFIPFFNAEAYIGNFGSVCVSMFLFISGYGMFLGCNSSKKSTLQYSFSKIKSFYITYWTYFLIFVPIGLIFFRSTTLWYSSEIRYSSNWLTFLQGFLGWSPQYNSEWWFVRMFVLLLLFLCPIYIYLARKNYRLFLLISISLFLWSWINKIDHTEVNSFLFWQIEFAMGIICARFKFYSSYFVQQLEQHQKRCLGLGIVFCCFFFMFRFSYGAKIDFLFIFLFIFLVVKAVNALNLSKAIGYLGKHSFQMWLSHSFLCYYYFQDFIYFPRWSPLVFIDLTITTLLLVIFIERSRFTLLSRFARS